MKKAQHDYKMYGEKIGVPITEDIVARAKRPSVDDVFPYFFDGTDIENYNQAQFIEQNNNCITIREWLTSEGVSKQSTGQKSDVLTRDEEMITDMEVDTEFDFGVDDIFNINNDHSSEPLAEILNDSNNNTTSDETPVKKKQLFQYETPSKNYNELI